MPSSFFFALIVSARWSWLSPPPSADGPPSPPNLAATGSPGARLMIKKVTKVIPNKVGIIARMRLSR